MRLPDKPRADADRPDDPAEPAARSTPADLRAGAGDRAASRYRELAERLAGLAEAHPSSLLADRDAAAAGPDAADVWWRGEIPGGEAASARGADDNADAGPDGEGAGGSQPDAADQQRPGEDSGPDGSRGPQDGRGTRPSARSRPPDAAVSNELAGPAAGRTPYRPWFSADAVGDPWFAAGGHETGMHP
jgi:hypothetical protein